MDYNLETGDPSQITNTGTDDFSILWNDQTQTHSKLMDTNLDDIEMNDELLEKLVDAMLQDTNTLDLPMNSEPSNQPIQSQLSCNHETLEPNSTVGVSDNTLQVWQKLLEGDNSIIELPQTKLSCNPSAISRSAVETPKPLVDRMSEDVSHRSLTRARSQFIASSTPHNAFLQTHFEVSSPNSSSMTPSFAKRKGVSTANVLNEESHSKNASSPESSLTNSSGPITRSRSASKASQSHSQPRLIPGSSSSRYNLRARNSACSQSNANLSSSQSEGTHRNSDPTPTHQYQTRSRTSSNKTKIKAPERCCAKLAVVVHRIRMSMIARLRCRRSSIRLPTPQGRPQPRRLPSPRTRLSTPKKRLQPRRLAVSKTRVEPRRLSTPKKRLQPRRLSLRKAKIFARGKNSRLVSSARKQ